MSFNSSVARHDPLVSQRSGFSLVELLAVIAIIAVLAAILFPVLANTKEAARQKVCLSNLKQLSIASVMYAEDHDDHMAGTAEIYAGAKLSLGFLDPAAPDNWGRSLSVYVRDIRVFSCSDISAVDDTIDPVTGLKPDDVKPTGVAGQGVATYFANGGLDYRSSSQIANPAKLEYLQDNGYRRRTSENAPVLFDRDRYLCNNFDVFRYSSAHNKGGNLAFCDGHAKYRLKIAMTYEDFGATDPDGAAVINYFNGHEWRLAKNSDAHMNDPEKQIDNWEAFYKCDPSLVP